jgi:hypothetical protein
MTQRTFSSLFRLTAVMFFTLGMTQMAAAQTNKSPDEKETLQALLSEVTMLRQAMQGLQRMTLDTYRSQLMVERVRMQKEDVRRLTAVLDEIRDDIVRVGRAIPNSIEEQKLLEIAIPQTSDPVKRAQFEFELKRNKDGVEMYKAELERQRDREQEVASQLQVSKAKLDELEGRLDTIEKSIEADREKLFAEKPSSPGKP